MLKQKKKKKKVRSRLFTPEHQPQELTERDDDTNSLPLRYSATLGLQS